MSTEPAEINQDLTPQEMHGEGIETLPPEEIVPSIDELDLDTLRLNIEQRLFESIREVGSTEEIDTHWLLTVLQNDYEKYLNFKLNKLDQDLFSFKKQEWVLDFKIETYEAWYKRYEKQRDLGRKKQRELEKRQKDLEKLQRVNEQLLSENEIEDACFDDLIGIRNESKARIELQIPLNDDLNRVSLSDGKVLILGDVSESEEDYGEFLYQMFDKAESALQAHLLDITQNQADRSFALSKFSENEFERLSKMSAPENRGDEYLDSKTLNKIQSITEGCLSYKKVSFSKKEVSKLKGFLDENKAKDLSAKLLTDSDRFQSVLESLKNHLEKSRQESRSIKRERESCEESFLDLTEEQKRMLPDKYERIQVLLKEEPELLYSAITLDGVEQNPERDGELFSFTAKYLIESNMSPSLVNDEGSSLLHMAVIKNQPEMVQILLEFGGEMLPNI